MTPTPNPQNQPLPGLEAWSPREYIARQAFLHADNRRRRARAAARRLQNMIADGDVTLAPHLETDHDT